MKKTLVSVIAVAAMVLGLAGCELISGLKKNANDQDSKSWGGQTHVKEGGRSAVVDMDIGESTAPTWALWTYTNGQVLDPQPEMKLNGKTLTFTFKEYSGYKQLNGTNTDQTKNFVLYINSDDETKDKRGRITVYRDEVIKIELKKAPETIDAVGVLKITNNEPVKNSSTYPKGNYIIQDIWPLDPKEADKNGAGAKYIVNGNMVFNKINIENENSIAFPVKAGSQIVGLYQPKRDDNFNINDATTYFNLASAIDIINDKCYKISETENITRAQALELEKDIKKYAKYNEEKNEYEILGDTEEKKAENAKKIQELYVKANSKIIFGKEINVTKHPSSSAAYKSINSSAFGAAGDPWFVKKFNGNIERLKAVDSEDAYFANVGPIEK